MKHVLFATGNSRKIIEASTTLKPFGISVEQIDVAMDEIQHNDAAEIAKAKARAAYAAAGKPIVVSDTTWEIPALGGFPGGYMKDINTWLQAEDWLALMANHADKRIFCNEHLAYYDGTTLHHVVGSYEGRFITEARGREQSNEAIEQVIILYGDKTMAEQLAAGDIASASEELIHWKQFGEWAKNQ